MHEVAPRVAAAAQQDADPARAREQVATSKTSETAATRGTFSSVGIAAPRTLRSGSIARARERDPQVVWAKVDPRLAKVRQDPRIQAVIRKIGL